jgi:hypothetical protein
MADGVVATAVDHQLQSQERRRLINEVPPDLVAG